MLTAITDAFLSVLNPVSIGAILLGVPIGMVIGAIPGLGGTIGMAIFIPFTFTMPTAVAIPFLLAIYRSTTYGGSVSAILLRIPGTPEAAATLVREALRVLPILRNVSIIRAFAGLRPATPDSLPILGEALGLKGFIIAAGHEGDGIALAPIAGKLVTDLIMKEEPAAQFDHLNLERLVRR